MFLGKRASLKWESGLLLVGVLLLSACTYMMATVDQRARASSEKVAEEDYGDSYYRFSELLAEIFVHVQERYVDEVEPQELYEATLYGMFQALDPHSAYLSADNFTDLEKSTEGEFSGIGIHIDVRNGILTVISPIPGTPAARVGLQAWDRIVEIEGETTEGITTAEAVKKLTGPVGTEVNIMVYRERTRKRIPFTIVRDRIKIRSVYSNVDEADYVSPYFQELLDKGIGYIRLTKFSENVAEEMATVLDRMQEAEVRGLILDGRFNSGGLLDEGIKVSDLFLEKEQVIVATKGREESQTRVYKAENGQKVDWPMIMLVNAGSASATEILAGALKDHHRAVLLGPEGQNTFGKAMVQSITPLMTSLEKDDDGNLLQNALRLTTARYYSPDNIGPEGKSMNGIGIEPDVTVAVSTEESNDLLMKGLLLGDPPLTEPGEEEEADKDDAKGDDESQGNDQDEKEVEAKDINEAGEEAVYFYEKNGKEDKSATTPDKQLKYGVDLLKALMIVTHGKTT